MRFVFLQFHFIELIFCIMCSAIHILGFNYLKEPFSHEFFFCGLYFMFMIFNLIGIAAIFVGLPVSVLYESVYALMGALGFIVAAFLSMGHAESDFHLTYLTDQDEYMHPYFQRLRLQSIFSITCGFMYLLHGMLTMDIYLAMEKLKEVPPEPSPPYAEFTEPDIDHNPTKLFIATRPFAIWLAKHFPRACRYIVVEDEVRLELFPTVEEPTV